jgi:hypothetical protein
MDVGRVFIDGGSEDCWELLGAWSEATGYWWHVIGTNMTE